MLVLLAICLALARVLCVRRQPLSNRHRELRAGSVAAPKRRAEPMGMRPGAKIIGSVNLEDMHFVQNHPQPGKAQPKGARLFFIQ